MFEQKKTDRKYTTIGSLPVQGEQKIKKSTIVPVMLHN